MPLEAPYVIRVSDKARAAGEIHGRHCFLVKDV